jgi:hypothetical protein
MTRLTLTGKTFGIKDIIKGLGFRWNPEQKAWSKTFDNTAEAEEIARRWADEGVIGRLEDVKVKRYMVKESWIFNLESMHDKIWCMIEDVREGKIALPIKVAGKVINSEDDLDALQEEAEALEWAAKRSSGVTGKEYGRIKDIVAWRVEARYAACMAGGMSEAEAGRCFEDM